MSALNTSSSHSPTKFWQPPNLHICITSSQFSLLTAHALHLWSHSLVRPHHLLYEWQIVPSSMLPLVSGINSRLPSVNHALISPILPHPVLWVAFPPSAPSTHHSHHPSPDTHAIKLSDILSCHSLHHHVYSPTHVHGHTLDLLITRDDHCDTLCTSGFVNERHVTNNGPCGDTSLLQHWQQSQRVDRRAHH